MLNRSMLFTVLMLAVTAAATAAATARPLPWVDGSASAPPAPPGRINRQDTVPSKKVKSAEEFSTQHQFRSPTASQVITRPARSIGGNSEESTLDEEDQRRISRTMMMTLCIITKHSWL